MSASPAPEDHGLDATLRQDVIPIRDRIAPVYPPRDAEHTVLHEVIAQHLEAFLSAAAEAPTAG